MANDLGKKLWKKIEMPQGYAYLADSLEDMPDEEVIEMAKGALAWHQESARVLRAFLKAHLIQREPDSLKAGVLSLPDNTTGAFDDSIIGSLP